MDYEKIMKGVNPSVIDEALRGICTALIGKGLSFRQAEALMDVAKERLKDVKI